LASERNSGEDGGRDVLGWAVDFTAEEGVVVPLADFVLQGEELVVAAAFDLFGNVVAAWSR
jgi:hypothetical protein